MYWLENKHENIPLKTQKIIFITANGDDSILLENQNINWIIFDHSYVVQQTERLIPF